MGASVHVDPMTGIDKNGPIPRHEELKLGRNKGRQMSTGLLHVRTGLEPLVLFHGAMIAPRSTPPGHELGVGLGSCFDQWTLRKVVMVVFNGPFGSFVIAEKDFQACVVVVFFAVAVVAIIVSVSVSISSVVHRHYHVIHGNFNGSRKTAHGTVVEGPIVKAHPHLAPIIVIVLVIITGWE